MSRLGVVVIFTRTCASMRACVQAYMRACVQAYTRACVRLCVRASSLSLVIIAVAVPNRSLLLCACACGLIPSETKPVFSTGAQAIILHILIRCIFLHFFDYFTIILHVLMRCALLHLFDYLKFILHVHCTDKAYFQVLMMAFNEALTSNFLLHASNPKKAIFQCVCQFV